MLWIVFHEQPMVYDILVINSGHVETVVLMSRVEK